MGLVSVALIRLPPFPVNRIRRSKNLCFYNPLLLVSQRTAQRWVLPTTLPCEARTFLPPFW